MNDTILPGLKHLAVTLGTTGLLTITGSDTTVAQAQLDSFIEKWKTEHVDTVFLSGYPASSVQFVTKFHKELPNLLLLSDNGQPLGEAQQLEHARIAPNPYEGLITAGGQTQKQNTPTGRTGNTARLHLQTRDRQRRTRTHRRHPVSAVRRRRLDTYRTINDTIVHDVPRRLQAAGQRPVQQRQLGEHHQHLRTDHQPWVRACILTKGKYDAEDNWRLEQIDTSLPPDGQFRPITPLQDITG